MDFDWIIKYGFENSPNGEYLLKSPHLNHGESSLFIIRENYGKLQPHVKNNKWIQYIC